MADSKPEKLLKKADSKCSVSLFRWSPDWDGALALYEEAAQHFKQAGLKERAKLALEKASLVQEKLGSPWHAAKHLEAAAALAKENTDPHQQVEQFFQRASILYRQAGRTQTGAECLCRAGKMLEDMDTPSAIRVYMEAVEIFEEEGKELYAQDAFRSAIRLQIQANNFADAAELLLRFAIACDKNGSTHSKCKAYLSAVAVYLYSEQVIQAEACFQDCLGVEGFSGSDEARAASKLLEAYREGTDEAVRKCVKETFTFEHLDVVIFRLVKKLPVGDITSLSSLMTGGHTAPSLTEYQPTSSRSPPPSYDDLNEDDLC